MSKSNSQNYFRRRTGLGFVIGFCAACIVSLSSLTGAFRIPDLIAEDLLGSLNSKVASGNVVIVGIDDKSVASVGGFPIDRVHFATLLMQLKKAGARRIVLDSYFRLKSKESGSVALEATIDDLPPEYLGLPHDDFISSAIQKTGPALSGPVQYRSDKRFGDRAAKVTVALPYSRYGLVRDVGTKQPKVSNMAAWLAHGKTAHFDSTRVDFSIDVNSIPQVSFQDVLADEFDGKLFEGKCVIVGATDLHSQIPIPVPRYGQLLRVHLVALAAETELSNSSPRMISWNEHALVIFVLLPIVGAVLLVIHPKIRIFVISAILLAGSIFYFLNWAIWTPSPLLLGLALTYLFVVITTNPAFHNIQQLAIGFATRVDYRLASLLDVGTDAILTFSSDGVINSANRTAQNLFDQSEENLCGKKIEHIFPEVAQKVLNTANENQPTRFESKLKSKSESSIHVDLAVTTVATDSNWLGYVSIRDISHMKAREAELLKAALVDPMTGLANRAAFEHELETVLDSAQQKNEQFALFLLDLNKFKQVNDTLGHLIGDKLLIEVSRRLESVSRSNDVVARLGGDEFTAILPCTTLETAKHIALRMVNAVKSLSELDGHSIDTGASIGVAIYPNHATKKDDLLRLADEAMYAAKRSSKGFVVARGR